MHAVALVLLSVFAQAGAQPASPEAKARAQALLKEGAQQYQQGAYHDALDRFEQAYAVFPSPKLLFNIGQATRELGRPVDSVDAFEKFLAQSPDAAPELIAEAKRSIAELSLRIGKLLVECTIAGAEISVDGRPVGRTPLVDLVRVLPGTHQVTATHPSATPAVENVVAAAGTVQTVVMRPRSLAEIAATVAAPAPAAQPPPAPALDVQQSAAPETAEQGWLLGRKWTWVAAGGTVVFAGVATVAGLMMKSKYDELNKSCGSAAGVNYTGCKPSDFDALDTRKNTANAFWGLTAAAAVATGVLFFVEGRPMAVAPMAGAGTGMMARVGY
jgi:hypothetical protein